MADTPRLDALEQAVRDLEREVERLRAELRHAHDRAPGAAAPGAVASRPVGEHPLNVPSGASARSVVSTPASTRPPQWRAIDIETLVGRYGALALAALAILLGVGVFLSWAVEHIRLGPAARVALGAMTSAAVAGIGAWLRQRGARRFGNVMFGLSLAIAHVVAWGAGPYLQVVPSAVALLAAAAASAALAALAWRENEEALFAVGLGGALIAPFVTSAGKSAVIPLLVFGVLVSGSAMLAIGNRPWRVAARLMMAGFGLYAGAGLAMPGGALGNLGDALARAAPAAFAVSCAWLAITIAGASHRLPLGRAALAVGVLAVLTAGVARGGLLHVELVVAALVITLTADVLVLRAGPDLRTAIVVPLGALAGALTAIPDATSPLGAVLAGTWALAATGASILEQRGAGETSPAGCAVPRVGHDFVAVLCAGAAVLLLLHGRAVPGIIALALVAGLASLMATREARAGLLAGSLVVLVVGTLHAGEILAGRTWYGYAPFISRESAAAAAIVAAWWMWSWPASSWSVRQGVPANVRTAIRILAPVVTFAWGYAELLRAFSREMSTFLIIMYLAASGVTAIVLGRTNALPLARHAGLGLAIIAGLRALMQASDLGFGLRLATYLVVGAFLLGVAYLYRATSEPAGEGPGAAPVTGT